MCGFKRSILPEICETFQKVRKNMIHQMYSISSFPFSHDQIPDRKPREGGRVNLGWQFEELGRHEGRQSRAAGEGEGLSYCILSQDLGETQEVGPGDKNSTPASKSQFPSARLHLVKAPQPLQMIPPFGDQEPVGDTSHSNPNLHLYTQLPKYI